MPRLPVQQQSRKPRQPKTVSSERLKLLALQPSEMLRPEEPPRLSHSRGNMAMSCGTWRSKSSKRRAEAKLTSSLLPGHPIHQPTGAQGHSGCFLPHFTGKTPSSPPSILLQRAFLVEEQPPSAIPPTPVPKQSHRPKDDTPRSQGEHALGGTTLKVTPEDPSSKHEEIQPWDRALKPSCTKAFCQDSDLVKEARREFFLKHSYKLHHGRHT